MFIYNSESVGLMLSFCATFLQKKILNEQMIQLIQLIRSSIQYMLVGAYIDGGVYRAYSKLMKLIYFPR